MSDHGTDDGDKPVDSGPIVASAFSADEAREIAEWWDGVDPG